jgi:hypothetical protein
MESFFLILFSFVPALIVTALLTTLMNSLDVRLTIPGLSGDIQFRLHVTLTFVLLVMALLSILVFLVTRVGGEKFLRRPILDLLGTSSC